MDAPTVRTGGWWVLLSVFCGLPACTPPPKRAAIPTPVWFEPTPEPVIEFIQPDWQTLDHADFPVYQPLETRPRLPDPAGIDDSELKLIDTIEHWLDPEPEPNFAGRFLAITHGCGTGCHLINFIDLSTGVWRGDLDLPYYYPMSEEGHEYPFGHTVHRPNGTINTIHFTNAGIFQFVQRHPEQVLQHRPAGTIKMFGTNGGIFAFDFKPLARVHAGRPPNDFRFFGQLPRPKLDDQWVCSTELANGDEIRW